MFEYIVYKKERHRQKSNECKIKKGAKEQAEKICPRCGKTGVEKGNIYHKECGRELKLEKKRKSNKEARAKVRPTKFCEECDEIEIPNVNKYCKECKLIVRRRKARERKMKKVLKNENDEIDENEAKELIKLRDVLKRCREDDKLFITEVNLCEDCGIIIPSTHKGCEKCMLERKRSRCRRYKANNRGKISKYNKKYKSEHKEEISDYNKKYSAENNEEIQAKRKERVANNPSFKASLEGRKKQEMCC